MADAQTPGRLHPWTHAPATVEVILARRGEPGSPARRTWDAVLAVAVDLDALASDPASAPRLVPRLHDNVCLVLAQLPAAGHPRRSAVAPTGPLHDTAQALVRLAGAPHTEDAAALSDQASALLHDLLPQLCAAIRPAPPPASDEPNDAGAAQRK